MAEVDMDRMEEVLFDGTKTQIEELRCDCGGEIGFSRYGKDFRFFCKKCQSITMMHGLHEIPNCVKYFGDKH